MEDVMIGRDRLAHRTSRALVQRILEKPHGQGAWSLQGFGMLRLYLADDFRLHVWDSHYAVKGVSEMHTHPWHLQSYVVAGEVVNHRYREVNLDSETNAIEGDLKYTRVRILCGPGGHVDGEPEDVFVRKSLFDVVTAGWIYVQRAEEIHVSKPADGTVTLIHRTFEGDPDHAYVYYPRSSLWVSAEPRPAMTEEIDSITRNALERWFS